MRGGTNIVILSDRNTTTELRGHPESAVGVGRAPPTRRRAPAHERRVDHGVGDVREVHHVALLLGFGASAVCPYLAYESIDALIDAGRVDGPQPLRSPLPVRQGAQQGRRQDHVEDGREHRRELRRLPALRGRGDLRDGLSRDTSRASLAPRRHHPRAHRHERPHAARQRLRAGPGERVELRNNGEYQWRRDGEIHLFNPRTVQKLQHATRAKRFDIFKEYTDARRRPDQRPRDAARSHEPGAQRDAPARSTRSRAPRRSSSASAPAPCPTDRSPKRRTARWRSP